MLRSASVRAWINTIGTPESSVTIQLVNGPKVLIDPGRAVDLLHFPAFHQMKVLLDHLSSVGRILSGFNEATTMMVVDFVISIKVGPVTHQVLFSVVEDLGPYNAIVGQA